jgi:DNA-binding transcriptional LysR family regulator
VPTVQKARSFVAVIEHGTMRSAARALGLAVTTISSHVASLENRARRRLLNRTKGVFTPNADGVMVARKCEAYIDAYDELLAVITPQGTYHASMPSPPADGASRAV